MSEPVGTPEPVSAVEDLIAEKITWEFLRMPTVSDVVVHAHAIAEVALAALSSAGYRVIKTAEGGTETFTEFGLFSAYGTDMAEGRYSRSLASAKSRQGDFTITTSIKSRDVSVGPWLPVEQEGPE